MKFLEDRLNAEDHDLILQIGTLPGFVRVLAPATLAWRRHRGSETGDFASGVSGTMRLLAREKSGAYPGGRERSRERHRILARHTRPTALACLRKGELKQGWELYRSTFGWNIELGHWKYVLAFPILAVLALLSQAIQLGSLGPHERPTPHLLSATSPRRFSAFAAHASSLLLLVAS